MNPETKDKYDLAIEFLAANPEEIRWAWTVPHIHRAGCLFQLVTPTGHAENRETGLPIGCLTTIRQGGFVGWTPEITDRIKNNHSIPTSPYLVCVGHLIHFAEEQRRLDKEIRQQAV